MENKEAHCKQVFLDTMSTYYDLMEDAGIDGFKIETVMHTLGFKFDVKLDSMGRNEKPNSTKTRV